MAEGKNCSKCKEFKVWSEYHKSSREPSGYKSACKICRNADKREHNKKTSESRPKKVDPLLNPDFRKCNTCKVEKPLTGFHKCSKNKLGRDYKCKTCLNEHRRALYLDPETRANRRERREEWKKLNPDKVKESSRRYRERNRGSIKKRVQEYNLKNRDKINASKKKYEQKNPHIRKRVKMRRREIEKNALVEWRDTSEIRNIYLEAREREKEEGIKYHVDHIIPLNHPNVCGLHTHYNLQIITSNENCSKQNFFDGTYENESWKYRIIDE